jgi:hypothetical protein
MVFPNSSSIVAFCLGPFPFRKPQRRRDLHGFSLHDLERMAAPKQKQMTLAEAQQTQPTELKEFTVTEIKLLLNHVRQFQCTHKWSNNDIVRGLSDIARRWKCGAWCNHTAQTKDSKSTLVPLAKSDLLNNNEQPKYFCQECTQIVDKADLIDL